MWIMVAGPYRSGSPDSSVWKNNLRQLNDAAYQVLKKGAGPDQYEQIMVSMSMGLTERCDAVLRIAGVSRGADQEVERFQARGLTVFRSVDEIPVAQSNAC
jgi:hypothetical protein